MSLISSSILLILQLEIQQNVFGRVVKRCTTPILGCGMTDLFMTTQIGTQVNQIIGAPKPHSVYATGKGDIGGTTALVEVGTRLYVKNDSILLKFSLFLRNINSKTE